MFLDTKNQLELFKGCYFDIDLGKVILPDGKPVNKRLFDSRFLGNTYTLDTANERLTTSAWEAFTQNTAYRPPFDFAGKFTVEDIWVNPDKLKVIFKDCEFDLKNMRAIVKGKSLTRLKFNVLFGGRVFCQHYNSDQITRSAWNAFTLSSAFRPTFTKEELPDYLK